MKVLIYSDIHLSTSSSIQRDQDDHYSSRLQSMLDIYDEIIGLANNSKVDIIIDAGDLLDKDVVTSQELEVLAKMLVMNSTIPEYHLNGNHGLGVSKFNSASITGLASNHTFIDEVTHLDKLITLVPFGSNLLDEDIYKDTRLIITHDSIVDRRLGLLMNSTLLDDVFKLLSDNQLVVNGHIHNPSKLSNNIINIGSSSGCNFGDGHQLGRTSTYPRVLIVDITDDNLPVVTSKVLRSSNLFIRSSSLDLMNYNWSRLKHHRIYLDATIDDPSVTTHVVDSIKKLSPAIRVVKTTLELDKSDKSVSNSIIESNESPDAVLINPTESVTHYLSEVLDDSTKEFLALRSDV